MIVLCGIPSEPPMAMVSAALDELGLAHAILHQRRFMETLIDVEIADAGVYGRLTVDGNSFACSDVTGIYTRLIDWHLLPELAGADRTAVQRCRLWHDALVDWIELAPARVMNRAAAMAS